MPRTICVTGVAGGLGGAIADLVGDAGDRTIGVDVRDAEICADLSTPDGRRAALEAVGAAAGGRLDGLVVAAGLGPQVDDGALIASVNYFAATAFLDGCVELLGAGDDPAAVAISSNSATLTPLDVGLAAAFGADDETGARELAAQAHPALVYGASKHALALAVRRRVVDWGARGVRLNAVAPGAFHSALLQGGLDDPELGPLISSLPVPIGDIPSAGAVASVVAFLLSEAARYVHGSVLVVDGGTDAATFPDRVP